MGVSHKIAEISVIRKRLKFFFPHNCLLIQSAIDKNFLSVDFNKSLNRSPASPPRKSELHYYIINHSAVIASEMKQSYKNINARLPQLGLAMTNKNPRWKNPNAARNWTSVYFKASKITSLIHGQWLRLFSSAGKPPASSISANCAGRRLKARSSR